MDLTRPFLDRSRHYLAFEYPAKIRLCLDVLPPDAIWHRPNADSNSVGNLLLHLAGNVRQWIVSSVGGSPDGRRRSDEFAARDGADAEVLWKQLRTTFDEADAVIATLDTAALRSPRTIQGRDVTVLDAVYHVVEHCALHTGQIILLTKLLVPGAIRFYEDAGGLAFPTWRGVTRP